MPPTATTASHAELAGLIARGDRRLAASLLVRDHAPAVLALCRAMVRDPRLAEDLSQDAFARAFGALEGFRGEASPRTWLLRIARNRCIDHMDRARRAPWGNGEPDTEPDDHAADVPPPYDLLARREDAARAMAALDEPERALVVLHFGHGVGYPELADAFGLREGTVRMRISRALARMRAALASDRLGEAADFELESPTLSRATRAEGAAGADWRGRSSISARDLAGAEDAARAPAGLDLEEWDATLASAPPMPTSTGDLDELAQTTVRGIFGDLDDASPPAPSPVAGAYAAGAYAAIAPAGPAAAPPTFGSLRDEVPAALRERLDALAASI
jgi:RNA polymerase sigma-70 factor (ECF subfamily)